MQAYALQAKEKNKLDHAFRWITWGEGMTMYRHLAMKFAELEQIKRTLNAFESKHPLYEFRIATLSTKD